MTSSEDQLKKRNVPSQHWEQFSIHFFFPLMMLELFPRKPIAELLVDVNRKEAKKKNTWMFQQLPSRHIFQQTDRKYGVLV